MTRDRASGCNDAGNAAPKAVEASADMLRSFRNVVLDTENARELNRSAAA